MRGYGSRTTANGGTFVIRIGAGVLAIVLLAGCSTGSQKSAQEAASAAPQAAQDALLAASVKTKLGTVDVDSATSVHVQVDHGAVTLSGEARTPAQRQQFEDAARSVSGVANVTDQLTINPKLRGARESLGDAALAAKVMGAIAAQAGVNVVSVKATAKDGTVTLTGSADSMTKKTLIVDTARSVSGVNVLVDHITVK